MAPSRRHAAPAPSETPTQNLCTTRFSDEDSDVPTSAAAETLCSGSSVPTGRPSQEQAGAPGSATNGASLAEDPRADAVEHVLASLELVVARLDKMEEQMDRDRLRMETRMTKMEASMESLTPLAEKRTPRSPDEGAITFNTPKTVDAKALSAFREECSTEEFTEEFKIGKPARRDTRELPGLACLFGFIPMRQPEMHSPFH